MPIVDFSNIYKWINSIYYNIIKDKNFYLVLYGGANSGKSVAIAQKIVVELLREEQDIFLIRGTLKSIRESSFKQIIEIIRQWNLGHLFEISDLKIKCVNGSTISCTGVDDTEKLKSIIVDKIWVEEATDLTKKEFIDVETRLRGHGKSYRQLIVSFNPVRNDHWLKNWLVEPVSDTRTIIHSTYRDNKLGCTKKDIERLEGLATISPRHYKIFAQGEWAATGKLIYNNWTVVPDDQYPDKGWETIFGLDIGYNDPTTLIKVQHKFGSMEVYLTEMIFRSGMNTNDIISQFKQLEKEHKLERYHPIYSDIDPKLISDLQAQGFNIQTAMKGPGSLNAGIDLCQQYRMYLHGTDYNVIREIQDYDFVQDSSGEATNVPSGINDHTMAAIRYAIFSHLRPSKGQIGSFNRQLIGI